MLMISPSRSSAIGPPSIASGEICPIAAPRVAPENLPSVISAMSFPLSCPEIEPGLRRCLLARFPYGLEGDTIVVVAVAHLHREPRYWGETGWSWRSFRNTKSPTFWVPDGPAGLHQYRLRTMFEEIALPWDWPAEANWHEARAYCAWLSEKDGVAYRLPSEVEHHALRDARQRDPALGEERDPVMVCDGASLARRAAHGCGD